MPNDSNLTLQSPCSWGGAQCGKYERCAIIATFGFLHRMAEKNTTGLPDSEARVTDAMVQRAVRMVIIICGVMLLFPGGDRELARISAQAPDQNLLINGDLELPYYAQDVPTRSVPNGWQLWVNRGDPESLPHTAAPQSIDGSVTWLLGQNNGTFMAAGYQRVEGLNAGEMLRLTAVGWLYTCDNPVTRCVIPGTGIARSNPVAAAALQVGIDPTGGTNPLGMNVRWSAPVSPYDRWYSLSVIAAAEAYLVYIYGSTTGRI